MPRTQTMVQLTDDLVAALDTEAARRGVSRSALIREILTAAVDGTREASITAQIVAGYRRFPPETPDAWGRLDAFADGSTRETLQRLDAEERREGLDPW